MSLTKSHAGLSFTIGKTVLRTCFWYHSTYEDDILSFY
jgi:hypothetical protein